MQEHGLQPPFTRTRELTHKAFGEAHYTRIEKYFGVDELNVALHFKAEQRTQRAMRGTKSQSSVKIHIMCTQSAQLFGYNELKLVLTSRPSNEHEVT